MLVVAVSARGELRGFLLWLGELLGITHHSSHYICATLANKQLVCNCLFVNLSVAVSWISGGLSGTQAYQKTTQTGATPGLTRQVSSFQVRRMP